MKHELDFETNHETESSIWRKYKFSFEAALYAIKSVSLLELITFEMQNIIRKF